MSTILLYALVPADRLSPSVGTTGGALSAVSEGSVAMLYDERAEPPSPTQDELVGFGNVLSEVARAGPTLPVRFGTVVDDLEEVRELLREREQEWHDRLAVVAGHVEMVVHARDDNAPQPVPASRGHGREYLTSRAAARRHTEATVEDLSAALAAHCREVRRLPASDEVRVACLVPADRTDELRSVVQAWADDEEGRHITTTGPWPPFSFTDEEAQA